MHLRFQSVAFGMLLWAALATGGRAQEPQPQGGARLVYDLPGYELSRALAARPGCTLPALVGEVRAVVQGRLGDRMIAPHGATGFAVEVAGDEQAIAAVRRLIEQTGKLQMCMVAADGYIDGGGQQPFDLDVERQRLQAWLDGGGREQLLADPRALDKFHDDAAAGPRAGAKLRWRAHVVLPKVSDPTCWDFAFHAGHAGELAAATVLVSDAADFHGGMVPARLQAKPAAERRLLELVAINMDELHFGNADLDLEGVRLAVDANGRPAASYRLRGERAAVYADWSMKHLHHHCAVLLDDRVLTAPRFLSRIPGQGQITGDFTKPEAEALVSVLRSGPPLPVAPVLLRQDPLGRAAGRSGR